MNNEVRRNIAKLNLETIHWDELNEYVFDQIFQCAYLVLHGQFPSKELRQDVYEQLSKYKSFRPNVRKKRVTSCQQKSTNSKKKKISEKT